MKEKIEMIERMLGLQNAFIMHPPRLDTTQIMVSQKVVKLGHPSKGRPGRDPI